MRYKNRTPWIILFTFLTVLSLSVLAFAAETDGAAQRVIVLYEDGADPAALETAIAHIEGAELLWSYDTFLSGAAVDAAPQALSALRALPGVTDVRSARSYDAPLSSSKGGDALPSSDGLKLMGADTLWEQGFTGDGTVIAVLDTGLLVSHEAFANDSLMSSPTLSKADVAAYAAKGKTAGQYISQRIPFAYDYYDRDSSVTTTNGHGTHVTALAAGYALEEDGSVRFRGGAPGAQILSMKIFPNGAGGGTDDSIVLRALEDAWNLGADVVNISISTGAGFSQDQALDGVYCRAFAQMAESGVIICCAAGNENTASVAKSWLPHLPTAAYTDYGSNCAPASYLGSVAIGSASLENGRMVPADYSSWGPASGLHLTPALLAFGGPVLSANVTGDTLYRSDYGTSMASPGAAGVFASLLQVLRERGVTDKAQAAQLAQSLLESTAQVLKSDSGVPVSPRKQGAGLADLSAAVSSDLVILDPLVELGESEDGKFTLSFTLRNLSQKSISASLDVTVLTDDYVRQGSTYYSKLTARDITRDVTVGGKKSVSVPAGGETTVSLPLTVSAALRQELSAVFTNGFYVEGFVTASGGSQPVHAAFLGYCGDWEAAPVLDPLDFRDVQDVWFRMAALDVSIDSADLEQARWYLTELNADMGANLAYIVRSQADQAEDGRLLGVNAHGYALHDDGRFAMPSQDTNADVTSGSLLGLDLYGLRNAAGIVMLVSDPETGTLYCAMHETWQERSTASSYDDGMTPAANFIWEGTDASGKPLPGGTEVRVDVYAWLDTEDDIMKAFNKNVHRGSVSEFRWLLDEEYAAYRELSFPLVLDGQAPTVSAAFSGDRKSLTLTLRDDQYLAYAAVSGQRRELIGEEAFFPRSAGESGTVTVRFPDGVYPDTLYIQTEDFAGNAAGYTLDVKAMLAGQAVSPERCAMLLLKDTDLSAWYHDAVDYVLRSGVMEADDEGCFRPGKNASRAEIVKALYQANGSPAAKLTASDLPFKDVSGRASYAQAVCWAYENGLVNGETETTFAGSANVSRQQFAVMLWRCAKLNGTLGSASGDLSAFPDRGSVASWAQEAMTWAVGQGLITGDNGRLNPNGAVTRAEAAQMLIRFLKR